MDVFSSLCRTRDPGSEGFEGPFIYVRINLMKMASSRSLLLLLLIGLALGFSEVVRADGGIQLEPPQAVKYDYSKDIELLKSKVLSLEAAIKSKDSILSQKDKQISTLETEMSSLHTHKEGAGAAEAQLASALSKVRELESQVRAVKEEAEKYKQEAKKEADRAKAVESSANAHLAEKEKVVKALSDQKSRLQKAERGLQIAEAAMLKAKAEAETKAKKLEEVHGAWLPPWAAAHAETLQKTASSRWETHAEPAVRNLQRSVSAKAMDAHGFMKPHLDSFKTKVYPVISDKWRKLTLAVAPHLETIRKAGVSSREYMSPHFETVQNTVDPYVQVFWPTVESLFYLLSPCLTRLTCHLPVSGHFQSYLEATSFVSCPRCGKTFVPVSR